MFLGPIPIMELNNLIRLQPQTIANDNLQTLRKQLKNDETFPIRYGLIQYLNDCDIECKYQEN